MYLTIQMDTSKSLTASTSTSTSTPGIGNLSPPPPHTSNLPEIFPARSVKSTNEEDTNTTNLTRPQLTLSTNLDLQSPPTYYNPQTYELGHPIKVASTASVAPLLPYNQLATQAQHPLNDMNGKVFDPNLRLCRICLESEQVDENDIENGQDYKADEEAHNLNSQNQNSSIPYQPTPAPTVVAPQKPSFRETIKAAKRRNWNTVKNPLIHPCHCQGTMAYIHVECLNRWRKESPRPESYYRCDTCHYNYNLYRPYWASMLCNRNFHRILTTFLVIFLVLTFAYIAKVFDVYGLKHTPRPYDPKWVEFHGPTILWMDLFYLIIGLIITSALGLVYVAVSNYWGNSPGLLTFNSCCVAVNFGPLTCADGSGSGLVLFFVAACFLLFLIIYGFFGAIAGIFFAVRAWVDWVCNGVVERVIEV